MKSSIAAAMALVFMAGTASAQDAEAEKPEKKICRTDKATGSLTRRTRICMTESQWRELNNRTRKGLEEMGQSGAGGTNHSANSANQPGM